MEFPKPTTDTGIGVHDDTNAYWKPAGFEEFVRNLREHGVTWYLLFVGDENKADFAEYLVRGGVMPILRMWPVKMPKAFMDMSVVEAYIAAGVKWIQCGNEFNLHEEWDCDTPWCGKQKPLRHVAEWYVRMADQIRERGGWPLTPPPSLGGHWTHRDWFIRLMTALNNIADEQGRTLESILYPGGIGLHCRSLGNPLTAGPADYDVSAREWEWFDGVVKSYQGRSLPMANLEAFDEPQWIKPYIGSNYNWDLWRDRNLEQMRWFDPANEGYRYPSYIFANCFWVYRDPNVWGWNHTALTENIIYDQQTGQGRETHLWKAMPSVITWTRDDGEPPPPPPPPPPVQPVKLRVFDMDGQEQTLEWAVEKYGVRLDLYDGRGWHCSQMKERSGPASVDIYLYEEDGKPAQGIKVEFFWPGGSQEKLTEVDGKVGFAYGPGSWITNPAVGGPHWIVVNGGETSDDVSRLGMLAGTNHDHLDLSFRMGVLEEPTPVDPLEVIMPLAEEKLEAIPVPNDWALPAKAIEAGFPIQVGGYGSVEINGETWVYQTFTRAAQDKYIVTYTKEGDWGNVQWAEVIRD